MNNHNSDAGTVNKRILSLEVGDQLRVTLQENRVASSFHFIGEHTA